LSASTVGAASTGDATGTGDATSADDATNPDGSPTFFAPTYGLLVWFDAADDASFSSGSAVAAWNDRSGNANHLAQAVASGQPTRVTNAIGGLPAVRFDGSNDTLTTSATLTNRAFHGFVVWQSTRVPPSNKSTVIANSRNFEVNHGHAAETARAGVSACASANCYTANSGWYDAKFEKGTATDTAYLWQFSFVEVSNDLVAEAWGGLPVTQVNPTELPVAPATPFYVGNCEPANCAFLGDVGEIVLFNRALTSDEKTQAVAYLTSKWSLSEPSN
jgi:hypothetical protein